MEKVNITKMLLKITYYSLGLFFCNFEILTLFYKLTRLFLIISTFCYKSLFKDDKCPHPVTRVMNAQ